MVQLLSNPLQKVWSIVHKLDNGENHQKLSSANFKYGMFKRKYEFNIKGLIIEYEVL
jgi:hypothetical protein